MTTVYTGSGIDVSLVATREPRIFVLRIDISKSFIDLSSVMAAVTAFFQDVNGRIVTHIRLVSSSALETPGMSQIVLITSTLMDLQSVMDTKLKGTIIEMGSSNKRLKWSSELFMKYYQPTSERAARRVFEVVDTADDTSRVLERILTHEKKKRERREHNNTS